MKDKLADNNQMTVCPFCGGSAMFTPGIHSSTIGCNNPRGACSVAPYVRRATFSEAQRAWNFRYDAPNNDHKVMFF
jgi:hypothetical protein